MFAKTENVAVRAAPGAKVDKNAEGCCRRLSGGTELGVEVNGKRTCPPVVWIDTNGTFAACCTSSPLSAVAAPVRLVPCHRECLAL